MKTGIYLSYAGLGANLLHLTYCHQIARKYGPVTIISLCKNLKDALADDPLIENVYYLNQYNKKFFDIFQLSRILKKFNFVEKMWKVHKNGPSRAWQVFISPPPKLNCPRFF